MAFELKHKRGTFPFKNVFSTTGYRKDSPDKNKPYNIIPSGNISMKGVEFPVRGTDDLGNVKTMQPGRDYKFPGDIVYEERI